MKQLILLFILCSSSLLTEKLEAQISFKINIGLQPIWGPVGYDHVEYYYLPDIEAYYYVPEQKYVYLERGHWISDSNLPVRYRNYDMYNSRKIVINEPRPYMHHQNYRQKYAPSRHQHFNQQSIRDSHEEKYFENKNHPEHSKWKENKRDDHHDREQPNRGYDQKRRHN